MIILLHVAASWTLAFKKVSQLSPAWRKQFWKCDEPGFALTENAAVRVKQCPLPTVACTVQVPERQEMRKLLISNRGQRLKLAVILPNSDNWRRLQSLHPPTPRKVLLQTLGDSNCSFWLVPQDQVNIQDHKSPKVLKTAGLGWFLYSFEWHLQEGPLSRWEDVRYSTCWTCAWVGKLTKGKDLEREGQLFLSVCFTTSCFL